MHDRGDFLDAVPRPVEPPQVTHEIVWVGEWDESEPGLRRCEVITYDNGAEVSRRQSTALYDPRPQTSEEAASDLTEVVVRRAASTGRPVVVTSFVSSGTASVAEVAPSGRLQHLGTIAVTPSLPRLPRARAVRPATRRREHRARRATRGSRASPSDPDLDDGELDPRAPGEAA